VLWALSLMKEWGDHMELIRTPHRMIRRRVAHSFISALLNGKVVHESTSVRTGKYDPTPEADFKSALEEIGRQAQRNGRIFPHVAGNFSREVLAGRGPVEAPESRHREASDSAAGFSSTVAKAA